MTRVTSRILLVTAAFGLVLSAHLWIEGSRGFEHGCWGLSEGGAGPNDCARLARTAASRLLGVPAAGWGVGFYFTVGWLGLVRVSVERAWAARVRWFLLALVVVGVIYALGLASYQVFVARRVCVPCLILTGLAVGLAATLAWEARVGMPEELAPRERVGEIGIACAVLLAAAGVVLGGWVVPAVAGARSGLAAAKGTRPVVSLRAAEWLGETAPRIGAAGAPAVIAFYDPNCAHCGPSFTALMRLGERLKDRAQVVVYPRVLWEHSLLQAQALEVARRHGKYFEMWTLQFERRKAGGMGVQDIAELFGALKMEMSDPVLALGEVRADVVAFRKRVQAAGIDSTPAIFIEGQRVGSAAEAAERLGRLVK